MHWEKQQEMVKKEPVLIDGKCSQSSDKTSRQEK